MARKWILGTFIASGIAASLMADDAANATKPANETPAAGTAKNEDTDVAAIRASVAAFVKAHQARDVKAIAALFAPNAKLVTDDNEVVEGREAIAASFEEHFAEEPDSKLETEIGSIKLIGADLAVETGTTKSVAYPGATPEYGKYTVLHAKRDGKWLMVLVRDMDGDRPSNHERLQPLAWLVGEWIDESPESVVSTVCRWSADKNFLMQDIRVTMAGKPAMQVTQRIGWDPLKKCVRAWVFDSEGGFGESVWTRDGDEWLTKATFVRSDGASASATNHYVRSGPDAYVWRSVDRVMGDETLPPFEVKVVRKPPVPGGAKKSTPGAGGARSAPKAAGTARP